MPQQKATFLEPNSKYISHFPILRSHMSNKRLRICPNRIFCLFGIKAEPIALLGLTDLRTNELE